jgi:hypothetical protein
VIDCVALGFGMKSLRAFWWAPQGHNGLVPETRAGLGGHLISCGSQWHVTSGRHKMRAAARELGTRCMLAHLMSHNVEITPRRSLAFFAILAILMIIASYVFVILLAAACVLLPYYVLHRAESPGFAIMALFVFGVAIAAAMLWLLIPRHDKFTPPGPLLDRSSHSRLFAEIDGIAAALEEPVPHEVYLTAEVNAWVTDRRGVMGSGSRRVMGLGLPLLSILTVSQFRAVLGHCANDQMMNRNS